MSSKVRALIAALVMIVVAAGSALFVGYRIGIFSHAPGIAVAMNGDVGDLFASGPPKPSELLSIALDRLEHAYYEPVAPSTPLAGEEAALRAYLHAKGVRNVALPTLHASRDLNVESGQLDEVLSYVRTHYAKALGSADGRALTETALRGVMDSVHDPYTVYLSPREIRGLNESLDGGNFGGIGVYIYQLKNGQIVVQPIERLPAALAGMKPGEVVDSVDGVPIRGLSLTRVERMIRGVVGSTVRLTTHPYGKSGPERTFAIVREIIHVPTVHRKMEDGFDYIRLSDFGQTSPAEVHRALLYGRTHHAKGYILDLRDNGGGLLDAAVKISSFFIPQGTIVSTIDRNGSRNVQEALGTAIPGLRPLVVLVNQYTASSSEITAGALQDYKLATLIGTRTFGKGVVQSIYPMPDNGALKITTARYLTPKGRDIEHKGILPDIVVPQNPDPSLIDTPRDKQLAAAKARLRQLTRS